MKGICEENRGMEKFRGGWDFGKMGNWDALSFCFRLISIDGYLL